MSEIGISVVLSEAKDLLGRRIARADIGHAVRQPASRANQWSKRSFAALRTTGAEA